MSDKDKGTATPAGLREQLLALASQMVGDDVAGSWVEQLQLQQARQEADRVRLDIIKNVTAALSTVAEALVKALPAGRELRILHVAAKVEGDKILEPAKLSFDVDMGGGLRSTGTTAKPTNGKDAGTLKFAALDGSKRFEGKTFKDVFLSVVEHLKTSNDKDKDKAKIPDSNYSANRELVALAARLKGRLTFGEVDPAPAPAKDADKAKDTAPAPAAEPDKK